MASKFYLIVNEDDVEELLEAVLEVLTTKWFFKLEKNAYLKKR